MNKTKNYLAKVRKKTGFSDYKISQEYNINQSNLSKYKSGKSALSETHAWLFANILNINPAEIVANTKLEQAKLSNNKSKEKFWQMQLENLGNNLNESLSIEIAQINPTVGDLNANAQKIIDLSNRAFQANTQLIVFPELALSGYPPEDLLLHKGFIKQVERTIKYIQEQIPEGISVVFGAPTRTNEVLYNSACLIQRGCLHVYHKQCLPNYGVFDEKRYFSYGSTPFVFECGGRRIGLIICEDAWDPEPVKMAANFGAQTIISLNASPFQINKHSERLEVIKKRALENKTDFIYVNIVGGQDELVFDGGSFAVNSKGEVTQQFPFFQETTQVLNPCTKIYDTKSTEHTIYNALVLATKDYVKKNNVFNGAVIGLSGGIDSALTLAIVADALGSENVQAIMMPYEYTSNASLEDARIQAEKMNVDYQKINIHPMMDAFQSQLTPLFSGTKTNVTEENLQARIRATVLMAVANKFNKILITTSNKSEIAVGYTTLYGDSSGGFAPLKDVAKTLVYQLAKYRNTLNNIIPNRVIRRAPSAELAPNQVDQDSLPEYDELDAILELFVEQKYSAQYIIKQGYDEKTVINITRMIINSEHKRRQAPPGPKITKNAFGKERRYPITSKFQFHYSKE